jgi:hypothetical protein
MTIGLARRAAAVTAVALALGLLGAGTAAAADSSASSNWAGYAVHRSGVRFRTASGSWTQPRVTCAAGRASYSSVWVGIGGYSVSSPALEQIGTELDCTASGHVRSNAWYELVPSASHTTSLIVHPGDRMRASVSVTGNQVKLAITDVTRHRSFTRALHSTVLDTTSAEWIVEAPSACHSVTDCQTLPLADFGSAVITGARATPAHGQAGTVSDRRWTDSRINLAQDATGPARGANRTILAAASPLTAGGSGFTVSYSGTASSSAAAASTAAAPTAAPRHPGDRKL